MALPPLDVWLVFTDGREVPVEPTYHGLDEQNLSVWAVALGPGERGNLSEVRVGAMPPRTTLIVQWLSEDGR